MKLLSSICFTPSDANAARDGAKDGAPVASGCSPPVQCVAPWYAAGRRLALTSIVIWALPACATTSHFNPKPLPSPPVAQSVRSAEKDGVRVTASILNDAEAQQNFAVDLASRQLQAIWVRIENGSQLRLWFLVAALDPDYYTPMKPQSCSPIRFRTKTPSARRAISRITRHAK